MIRQHVCHAEGCERECPPEHLMCRKHWYMVPVSIRHRVRRQYVPGQCDSRKVNEEWLAAAREAIWYVATLETQGNRGGHRP